MGPLYQQHLHNKWREGVAVCIASGPSLTFEDTDRVRQWRDEQPKRRFVVVTNSTIFTRPWADLLYGKDAAWWQTYAKQLDKLGSAALRVTVRTHPPRFNTIRVGMPLFEQSNNSGFDAIRLSALCGARRVLLLGYDMQLSADGRAHHHEDHPAHLGNAASIQFWMKRQDGMAAWAETEKIEVLNCTRATALTCWKRKPLEEALCDASC